jgi:hypothetical protein
MLGKFAILAVILLLAGCAHVGGEVIGSAAGAFINETRPPEPEVVLIDRRPQPYYWRHGFDRRWGERW